MFDNHHSWKLPLIISYLAVLSMTVAIIEKRDTRFSGFSLCKWSYDKQLLALACAGPQDSSRLQWMWHWCLPGYWDLSASSIDPNVLYCTWLDFQMKNYQLCTILDLFWSSCEKCNFRCQKLLIFTLKPNTVIALYYILYMRICA